MIKTVKNILASMLVFMFVIGSALPCLAAAESGVLTVKLEDKEKNKINGTTVHLCQIAELNNTGYYPANAFENSGISISGLINSPDEATAKKIFDYIKDNNINTISAISENGKVSFSELDMGVWCVFCDESSKYIFNPFIVFLPYESDEKLHYEISSAPKIEDSKPDEINIYVIKKWDDKNNAAKKRPDTVTVEVLNGDTVVTAVELSEKNGWAHTFSGLPKGGEYSIKEKTVTDYTPHYSGDKENGFVVINSYSGEKLPQTGQYWWPIIIIAIAGICFVLLGIVEIGAKKNDKNKK